MFNPSKKLGILSALFAGIIFTGYTSCIKQPVEKGNKLEELRNIITSGPWREISDRRLTILNDYDLHWSYPVCRKDDFRRFNKDSTGEVNEGLLKCNSIDPQSRLFHWKFLNKYGTSIQINSEEFIVGTLNDTTLHLSTPYRDPYADQRILIFKR